MTPKTWRLDAPGQTLVIASTGGIPEAIWWGARLPDNQDLTELAAATRLDVTGGMMDRTAPLSLCPLPRDGWQGQPGLVIAGLSPRFTNCQVTSSATELSATVTDAEAGLTLTFRFEVQGGIIAASTLLQSSGSIDVTWLAAPVLPAPAGPGEVIDVSGRWIGEFQLNRTAWTPGIRMRESRTGRSGHEHPPYAFLTDGPVNNASGTVRGMHYGWSGGHRMIAEELPDGRRHVQWGHASGAYDQGTSFETAPLVLTYSDDGLNGCGVAMQRHIRDHVVTWPKPAAPRPVHYNCWEAIYFDHDLATLSEIANRAAAIGAERFVLDDGWFGKRDNDRSSLGDWTIDTRKWPSGLTPLIRHVHSLGMTFGLWFEPEMVNPDSDLFRAHPEWVLGPLDQTLGRHQMVLNMSLPEVRDYLFKHISAILASHDIDYIKWDHNRLLPVVSAAQTDGTYALLARLRAAFPLVEIESCASGGGRIDAGILRHTSRVWLSDSNDALERLRMQHDAALFLPSAVTGSHVGPQVSHTSGRVLSMEFRAWVAAQRHLGFEMDLRDLTEAAEATLRDVTAWYRENRDWMMAGDIHRLDSADPAVTAEIQIAADGSRFVVFAGQSETSRQILPRPLRLTGLEAGAEYSITLRNPANVPPQSRGPVALKTGTLTLTGKALMALGVQLPVAWPATMSVIEGTRVKDAD